MEILTELLVVGQIVWLVTLVLNLKADDMESTDRICWTIVLCTLNVLGMILYFVLAPSHAKETAIESEKRIKKAANEGKL